MQTTLQAHARAFQYSIDDDAHDATAVLLRGVLAEAQLRGCSERPRTATHHHATTTMPAPLQRHERPAAGRRPLQLQLPWPTELTVTV
jgi:hypothetical protein